MIQIDDNENQESIRSPATNFTEFSPIINYNIGEAINDSEEEDELCLQALQAAKGIPLKKKTRILSPIKEEGLKGANVTEEYKKIFKKCHADLKTISTGAVKKGNYYKSPKLLKCRVLKFMLFPKA